MFFQKYFKGLRFQLSWGRKKNKYFHKSNYSLMSIYGLLLYSSKNHKCFPRKSSIYLMTQVFLMTVPICVILASWQMKHQEKGSYKIIFFLCIKEKIKIYIFIEYLLNAMPKIFLILLEVNNKWNSTLIWKILLSFNHYFYEIKFFTDL